MNIPNPLESRTNYINFIILLLFYLGIILIAVKFTGDFSIYFLITLNILLLVIITYIYFQLNVILVLLSISIIPLVYLNNSLHYVLKWVVIQDIPLFIIFLIAATTYLFHEKELFVRFDNLFAPLLIFTLYSTLSFIIGIINNNTISFAIDELYHIIYYPFALVIFYLIKQKKHYHIVITLLIAITIIISLQYLFFKYLFNLNRIVSFHSGLLIFPMSYFFTKLLFHKQKSVVANIGNLILLIIVILALFITLTRSLWLSAIVSIFSLILIYLNTIKKMNKKTIIIFLMILIFPFIWFGLNSSVQVSKNISSNKELEYRSQSLSNVTEDASFLMRVELGLYIYQKFLDSPIVGSGLGDKVKYKILSKNDAFINYPDGSWIFFLWKGGVIGFLIYLWLYIKIFKTSLFILHHSMDLQTKIYILAILGTLSGLILYSQFTAILIKYKSDIFFSVIIAYLMFEFDKIKRANSFLETR